MRKGIKHILWNFGILLISVLVCLIIGELAARVVSNIHSTSKLPEEPPCAIWTELERRYVSNWRGICLAYGRKFKVSTNSMGLRERELPFEKENKLLKLLFLGDSITFGGGVDVDATFVRTVENLLNSHSSGRRFLTINAGVAAASTIQEITLLRDVGLKYHPDIVVLDFFLNDIILVSPKDAQEIKDSWEGAYLKHRVSLPFKDFFANRSELYKLLNKVYRNLLLKMNLIEVPRTVWDIWGSSLQDGYYDEFKKYIEEIKEIEKEKGFKLVIVCFPNYFQVLGKPLGDIPQERLSAIAKDEGIPFLDLLPLLRDKRETRALYLDWAHFTPKGHKLVAEEIHQFLVSKGGF